MTGFLLNTGHQLKIIADGYGPDLSDVWRALDDDPNLVVIDAPAVPSRTGVGNTGWAPFNVEGVKYEDQSMAPFDIEVREPPHRRSSAADRYWCDARAGGRP